MRESTSQTSTNAEYDVVIVGGGPAGCSAGVFTARYGLDTVFFDRGNSSLRRCAHLENYLGFPAGIDIETFYQQIHAHAEAVGCTLLPDMVESIDRADDGEGFVVQPQEGDPVTARRVIAAARYDVEYVRGLDEAMIETYEYGGEVHERFDRSYPDRDGSTPIEGLYVASPADEDDQAIMAAGHGARVARRVIADARIESGWWAEPAEGVDWVRREATLDNEWRARETWVEWFDDYYGEDAPVEPGTARFERVRESYIDERRSTYLPPDEIGRRAEEGQRAMAGHVDVDAVVSAIGETELLERLDDEVIAEYAERRGLEAR